MKRIVTKENLDLLDRYEGDLGLLAEPWACKEDRLKISSEQARVLGEYIEKLQLLRMDKLSKSLRELTMTKVKELESLIDREVVEILKQRI